MDERHDVVIVGGGIMGATALFEFARRGIDALLLEQSRPTAAMAPEAWAGA